MAEYPSRSCANCEDETSSPSQIKNPEYISKNTTPQTKVRFKEESNLKEGIHGVPATYQSVDLTVSPVSHTKIQENMNSTPKPINTIASTDCPSCLKKDEDVSKGVAKIDCPSEINDVPGSRPPEQPKKGILKSKQTRAPPCCCDCVERPNETHATAGRAYQAPAGTSPAAKQLVRPELQPIQDERGACYLPQPQDALPVEETGNMGPLGPWATGRLDWGPLAGLTGTRPVVDKYSIARYSEGDWRAHNKVILEMSNTEKHRANLVDWNGRQCLEQTQKDVTAGQEDNTRKLNQRVLEIHRWKCELERAIAAASEEIYFTEEQRRRLKQASSVLTWPESIAGECLERRTGRMDGELVRDEVEEELIKELALCSELRDIFNRTLKDIEKQLLEDKTAKQRLEMDWSDKTISHEIDSINMALSCRSTILLFKPGSVIFPAGQSSTDYWEHFTRETLLEGEATRQRSVTLRGTLDAILINAARDLRNQADKVELALAKRIACTEEVTAKLESQLKQILQSLADVEDLMKELRAAIRRMDTPMKKAQTRLDNRLLRPRVENCRDAAHFGLVEEVKSIAENVAALQAQLNQAETSQTYLMNARGELEREIMLKRKSLEIDRDRTRRIRSYYPSTAALSGH